MRVCVRTSIGLWEVCCVFSVERTSLPADAHPRASPSTPNPQYYSYSTILPPLMTPTPEHREYRTAPRRRLRRSSPFCAGATAPLRAPSGAAVPEAHVPSSVPRRVRAALRRRDPTSSGAVCAARERALVPRSIRGRAEGSCVLPSGVGDKPPFVGGSARSASRGGAPRGAVRRGGGWY
jgi:hypothetical protein